MPICTMEPNCFSSYYDTAIFKLHRTKTNVLMYRMRILVINGTETSSWHRYGVSAFHFLDFETERLRASFLVSDSKSLELFDTSSSLLKISRSSSESLTLSEDGTNKSKASKRE